MATAEEIYRVMLESLRSEAGDQVITEALIMLCRDTCENRDADNCQRELDPSA
jgi:hypothetical protein